MIKPNQPKLANESDLQVIFRSGWLVLLALINGLACFLFPWFLTRASTADPLMAGGCMVLLGVIISQLVIVAFLFAFFPAGLVMRLSLVIGLTSMSICLLTVGNIRLDGPITDWFDMYLCWVPILIAGWAIPFFAAKALFGWSLRFNQDHHSEDSRMNVSSMLVGTALIACCLTLLKTGHEVRIAPALATSLASLGFGLVFAIPITRIMLTENRMLMKVVKCEAISIGPALVVIGGHFAAGLQDPTLIFATIALVCLLNSYCLFLIGIGTIGLQFAIASPT